MFKRTLCAVLLSSSYLAASFTCFDCLENGWANMEYLFWQIENSPTIIPLVVQGPDIADGAPLLDVPGNEIVLGNSKIGKKWRSGGRFTLGYWWDDDRCSGIDISYFFIQKLTKKSSVFSDGLIGSPFLAVPFIDSNTGDESSILMALPGSFEGAASLKASNMLQGAEINLLTAYFVEDYYGTLNVSLGFRYLNFAEKISFNTNSPYIAPIATNIYNTRDEFKVQNNFYGGQLGADYRYACNGFLFNLKGKIAIGAMNQLSHIRGRFVVNDFTDLGEPLVFPSGYFALRSNKGHHRRTQFSVIPEINLNLGYEISEGLSLYAGYNFLYVTQVARAARQMDRTLNPTQSPLYEYTPTPIVEGEPLPKGSLRDSNLWVQGINVGLEYLF